ncbi:MAG TPA: hypothetical protein ENK68_01120, partial [Epsilonproteobacteria bacterium]|nr:hypothetical protein [Campylobacterota bacterium]
MKIKLALGGLLLSSLVYAQSVDEALEGFDDTSTGSVQVEQSSDVMDGFDDTSTSSVTDDSTSLVTDTSTENKVGE